jgi:hypothetical protein
MGLCSDGDNSSEVVGGMLEALGLVGKVEVVYDEKENNHD